MKLEIEEVEEGGSSVWKDGQYARKRRYKQDMVLLVSLQKGYRRKEKKPLRLNRRHESAQRKCRNTASHGIV
jgi:hypothetical protein